MDELMLVFPTAQHRAAAMDYVNEFFSNGENIIYGDGGLDHAASYDAWLEKTKNDLDKVKLLPGRVLASTYFAMGKCNGKLIGIIQIRHALNAFLEKYGGHIGYSIRPTERHKGYGTQMLGLALIKCSALGIEQALIVCDKQNAASAKTIINNGGIYESDVVEEDGNIIQRYWVRVKSLNA